MHEALFREPASNDDAVVGLSYILNAIERAPGYKVNIGQIHAAMGSLRWAIGWGDRIADLELALKLALERLGSLEPGDSRAVSDSYVAMAAIQADLPDLQSSREIIREELARCHPGEAEMGELTRSGV